ncbi:MAG TPA: CheR family methyltransferase [Ohtaekwangia sp.]|uniref:CheR family methyltransferase n=1 Tax=Ohtaekwangia sp. TaxID=2066019 RepID=UPI002F93E412
MESSYEYGFVKMDDESFDRLSTFVTREYGIKLPISKKSMLESRLNKKVKSLGLDSYKTFLDYLFSKEGMQAEVFNVIDLITTNKTDFFREAAHFQFLTQDFLPRYQQEYNRNALKIWSAGCSTGEEPYTLVMALEEYRRRHPELTYSLLASDISLRVIQTAFQGIYTMDRVENIPMEMKRTYFMRSKTDADLVRVKPQYRNKIQYKRINLMDDQYSLSREDYDMIFCRNVLIYFDKQVQERVLRKFCGHLRRGGLLFLGHSESIMGMSLPLKQVRPTVYQVTT